METLRFTKIQRWEYKLAKPTATEWKEIRERSSTMANSHDLLTCGQVAHMSCSITCLSNGTSFLAVTCPCKIQAGWPFLRPHRNADFSCITPCTGIARRKETMNSYQSQHKQMSLEITRNNDHRGHIFLTKRWWKIVRPRLALAHEHCKD